ncbi:MAG TPA: YihY/virulence factor BrkB family protein [Anaerolineales bacterium]|nr:YihY/virulence factor BrkB family protein [Anaerolineales bacterium]
MAITYSTRNAAHSAAERLRVLDTSAITFTKCRGPHAAASLAYYTFFSIFPLMLVFILAGSYFLDQQSMLQRVTQGVQSVLPISQQFVVQNLQQVLQQRTAVGIFVLISLLWSASSMFNNLAYEINEAWPEAKNRNFVRARLIGLDMIAGLTALLVLSIILDSLSKYLSGLGANQALFGAFNPWAVLSSFGSWVAVFMLYFAMYHWVPTVPVRWWAAFWGALAAAIGWKAATTGFAWYLSSPFARYELVYGSLGAIVAFLFLIYIIALVTLFGAHLTSAVDHLQKKVPSAAPARAQDNKARSPAESQADPQHQLAHADGTRSASDQPEGAGQADKQEEDTDTTKHPPP